MRLASRKELNVIPRGAGTNLSGGCIPTDGGIILALNRLDTIIEIDPVNETALVEPGVPNMALQHAAGAHGFMYAPDPASLRVATIGGNIAESAGGMRGVKYGVAKDHLLGLEVVLSDGEIVHLGENSKYFPGIDVTGIFCGSEGTFGIITKIRVKLTRLCQSTRTMMAIFGDLQNAGKTVSNIISHSIVPVTLEIMDRSMIRAVDDFLHLGLPRDAEALLLIEIDGCEEELDRQANQIVSICFETGATQVDKATSEAHRQDLWRARRSGNGALGRIKPAYMVQDVTVPRQKLPDMLSFVAEIAQKYDIVIAQLAHAGDGNLHPHLLYDPFDKEEYKRVEQAANEIFMAALDAGGTLTGEHGIGIEKKSYMELAFSPEDMAFMRDIKRALDPKVLLNRGKILDMPGFLR
jgi:glycolate oxidase